MMDEGCGKQRTGVGRTRSSCCAAQATLLRALLRPLASVYGLAVRARIVLYERGWLARRRLPCRVISVGNLTVGGTGKTPMVIWLAERLLAQGLRVAVLSRGYRRQSGAPFLLVSDGRTVLAGAAEAGDEPYLIARRCPAAVVAVGGDRYRLGQWVLKGFPIDCMVLDDGFQHVALQRDVDLLLVDASDPMSLRALLPAGRLREPLAAAGRATALLLTRVDMAEDLGQVLGPIKSAAVLKSRPILVRFKPEGVMDLRTGENVPVESVAGRTALVFSGIANPASFTTVLTRLGVKILDELVFPDHYAYRDRDMGLIGERAKQCQAEMVVTTEKDAGKIAPLLSHGDQGPRIMALRIGAEVMEGREQLEEVLSF
ncbi:MAG: tetraacyldisaccharide 4'-kinase [Nitrospirae bacterium]|nr:MAG: tetraacyldisaccharide 4'-kinase [Nitrospirota bacterium]